MIPWWSLCVRVGGSGDNIGGKDLDLGPALQLDLRGTEIWIC